MKALLLLFLFLPFAFSLSVGIAPADFNASFDKYYKIKVQFRFFNPSEQKVLASFDIISHYIPFDCSDCKKNFLIPARSSEINSYVYTNVSFFRPERFGEYNFSLVLSVYDPASKNVVALVRTYTLSYNKNLNSSELFVVPSNVTLGIPLSNAIVKNVKPYLKEALEMMYAVIFLILGLSIILIAFLSRKREIKIK